MPQWQPDEHGLQDTDEAGDDQYGKVYSIRYRIPQNADGTYSLITVGFYCQDRWQANGEPIEREDAVLTDPPLAEERYGIGQQVEFMICRDPDDPGGTEEWCDYVYRSSWFARAEPFPDEHLKALMERFKSAWIEWDGLPFDDWIPKVTSVEPVEDEDWERTILTPALVAAVREILWQRDDGMNNTEWLDQTFKFEYCEECGLGANAHTVGPDPLGNRHAWCMIADPQFALKIARENAEKGDTTRAANGFSEESLRRERFEAAINALSDAGVLQLEPGEVLWYRSKANREVETNAQAWDRSDGARWLSSAFDEIAEAIKTSKENHATEV